MEPVPLLNQKIKLLVKFNISENARYLSHSETLRLFQRACLRTAEKTGPERNWSVAYSKGFNPRPKISLPLPRPVAVESDDELFCILLNCPDENAGKAFSFDTKSFAAELSRQLPAGFNIIDVSAVKPKTQVMALEADYFLYLDLKKGFPLQNNNEKITPRQYIERLSLKIDRIMAEKTISVERPAGHDRPGFKDVEVRRFIKSVRLEKTGPEKIRIVVRCAVTQAGSIRINEVLNLLLLDYNCLDESVKRSCVKWKIIDS